MLTKIIKWLNDHHIPVRLLLSVMAGIVASKVLMTLTHIILHAAGIFPALDEPMFDSRLLIISLILHSVYAVISAYITAWIAKERANKAVFILGTKEAILWLLGIILMWKHAPLWFNITKAVLGIPLAIFGGKIYGWMKEKRKGSHELR